MSHRFDEISLRLPVETPPNGVSKKTSLYDFLLSISEP